MGSQSINLENLKKIIGRKPTTIDITIAEMWQEADLLSFVAKTFGGGECSAYLPQERLLYWQRQLNRLRRMPEDHPKKNSYKHEVIVNLASLFGLKYAAGKSK